MQQRSSTHAWGRPTRLCDLCRCAGRPAPFADATISMAKADVHEHRHVYGAPAAAFPRCRSRAPTWQLQVPMRTLRPLTPPPLLCLPLLPVLPPRTRSRALAATTSTGDPDHTGNMCDGNRKPSAPRRILSRFAPCRLDGPEPEKKPETLEKTWTHQYSQNKKQKFSGPCTVPAVVSPELPLVVLGVAVRPPLPERHRLLNGPGAGRQRANLLRVLLGRARACHCHHACCWRCWGSRSHMHDTAQRMWVWVFVSVTRRWEGKS